MKKVLIVAYYFPPSGGPGVQRVLKFVQYLRDFGWEPVILTVEDGTFPARDESLLDEIPDGITVRRTDLFEPYDLYRKFTGRKKDDGVDVNTLTSGSEKAAATDRIAELIRSTLFIPDARIGWRRYAVAAGKELLEQHDIAAIYSSSPPYTCSLIARDLKRASGLPWVAGFRDPWTGFLTTPDRWFVPAAIDRRLERSVFREADRIDVAWTGIADDAMAKVPELPPKKFVHLPNGFDSADFPTLAPNERVDSRFTITYTGSMYGVRTPEEFLTVLAGLLEDESIPSDDVRVRFIGRFGDEVHAMFDSFPIESVLEVEGYLPHRESIRQLLLSDLLLLVVDTTGDAADIVPGKVYEYIGTGRPVLAIAPTEGAVARLLTETNAGKTAHQSEIEKIRVHLLAYYDAHRQGIPSVEPDEQTISSYERRDVTRRLAETLDEVTSSL